jgi:hypothetical protein
MPNEGYIKLWRKSLDTSFFRNINLMHFWIWCLLKASHKEKVFSVGFQEVTLNPGEFVFGRKKASEETGLSEQTIRTCLTYLQNMENLTIKTTNKFSVISIVNWNEYQGELTNKLTNEQPTTNQQLTTNKNDKNDKNVKKSINNPINPLSFDSFWEAYPKKQAKQDAIKAFNSINPDEELLKIMKDSIEKFKKTEYWTERDGKYIPLPATWLNKRRWEDEVKTKTGLATDW